MVNQAKYHSNGTGRDTYISLDNGGFKKPKPLVLEYRSPKKNNSPSAYADRPWAPSIMARGHILDETLRKKEIATKQAKVSYTLSRPKHTFAQAQYDKYTSPKKFTGYTNTSSPLPALSPGGTTAQPFSSSFSPKTRSPQAKGQWGSSPRSETGSPQASPWY